MCLHIYAYGVPDCIILLQYKEGKKKRKIGKKEKRKEERNKRKKENYLVLSHGFDFSHL